MTIEAQAEDFLAQKRIAVVGVSRSGGTGNGIFTALRDRGYEVFPVNPHAAELEGVTSYSDLKSIPGGVDAAVVVTRPEASEAVLQDCVEAGVGRVWLHYNALFGAGNSSVSPAAVAYGREHGIDVIAGGCPLMFGQDADFGHRCMRWLLNVTGKLPR